jgi:hypothetical protein
VVKETMNTEELQSLFLPLNIQVLPSASDSRYHIIFYPCFFPCGDGISCLIFQDNEKTLILDLGEFLEELNINCQDEITWKDSRFHRIFSWCNVHPHPEYSSILIFHVEDISTLGTAVLKFFQMMIVVDTIVRYS